MPIHKNNRTRAFARFTLALATVLWMALIFYLSGQPGAQSGKISTGITRDILHAGEKMGLIKPGKSLDTVLILKFDDLLRSSGHFMAFLILGILVYSFFRLTLKNKKSWFIYSFLFCAVYAISDEFHQHFVPGRAVQLSDFIIDCTGTIFGIFLLNIIFYFLKRKAQET